MNFRIVCTFITMLLIGLLISCQPNKPEPSLIEQIDKIQTSNDVKTILEKIHKTHRDTRSISAEIEKKSGKSSQEFRDAENEIFAKDAKNLEAIDALIQKKGYPKASEVGIQTAMIPWIIIRNHFHIPTKEKHLPILKQAWQEGNISENEYLYILQDIYKSKKKIEFGSLDSLSNQDKIRIISDSLKYTF
ncbi:MAG: hypothetical protein IPP01_04365 [Saprospiraceae bacterium]|nr:hypothetical protein [Saprospiraceae bacterium]